MSVPGSPPVQRHQWLVLRAVCDVDVVIGSSKQPVRQVCYRIHLQTDTEGDGPGKTAGQHGREGPLQIKQEGPGGLEREGAGGGSQTHPGCGRTGAG